MKTRKVIRVEIELPIFDHMSAYDLQTMVPMISNDVFAAIRGYGVTPKLASMTQHQFARVTYAQLLDIPDNP